MIELLTLYFLSKKVCTMYRIYTLLKSELSVLSAPSYGTLKPALDRLVKSGFVSSQKTMSKGGRPSVYYSITDKGRDELRNMMLSIQSDNSHQFMLNARVRLYCSDILTDEDLTKMIKSLKAKLEQLCVDTHNLTEKNNKNFYAKLFFDNLNCEYKNFLSLLEGVERAGKH